jgi:hypothetical protein
MYMPMTGLGLYGGHRGNRWLKSRIKIFKQFVLPSLLNQTSRNFILWGSFRYEDRNCPIVREFKEFLDEIHEFKTVFTFSGVCMWDDKYLDYVAYERLISAVHGSMGELINVMGESDTVLMSIQPSDDCYYSGMVEEMQRIFKEQPEIQAVGYQRGYVMDYVNRKLAEWNPKTNPPFFTIKFSRETFIDPYKHVKYTGPYKSHEYVGDALKYLPLYDRGFLVGTHSDNISTVFDHPYAGDKFIGDLMEIILSKFGLANTGKLLVPFSIRRIFFDKLPYKVKRKLRYLAGEKKWVLRPLFNLIYNILRA